MKSSPILYKGEMVRAILEDRKRETRRIVNPQWIAKLGLDRQGLLAKYFPEQSPYGKRGDRLWVKETFTPWADDYTKKVTGGKDACLYRADYRNGTTPIEIGGYEHWKPSIFMPKIYSRITLEITGIRVERLQDISEADAIAEGVPFGLMGKTHRIGYENLWNSINGVNAWDKNPWVWVIEFRRVLP